MKAAQAPSVTHSRATFLSEEGYEVADSKNIPTMGITCEEYASLMEEIGIDALICNGIPTSCRIAFEDAGIHVHEGAQGNALEAAQGFAAQQAVALDEELEDDD